MHHHTQVWAHSCEKGTCFVMSRHVHGIMIMGSKSHAAALLERLLACTTLA